MLICLYFKDEKKHFVTKRIICFYFMTKGGKEIRPHNRSALSSKDENCQKNHLLLFCKDTNDQKNRLLLFCKDERAK